jgi:hypothetical protein
LAPFPKGSDQRINSRRSDPRKRFSGGQQDVTRLVSAGSDQRIDCLHRANLSQRLSSIPSNSPRAAVVEGSDESPYIAPGLQLRHVWRPK